MKIGILTSYAPYNFGANLQAFASMKYLISKNHEVLLINYNRTKTQNRYRKRVPKIQWAAHDSFIDNSLQLTRQVDSKHDLCNLVAAQSFDGIIVGSDAVWSYPADYQDIPAYFMDWLFNDARIRDIPIASMSVTNMSNGFRHLSKKELDTLSRCIRRFKYITVRDNWTMTALKKHVPECESISISINSDPVFCMDKYISENWDNRGLVKKNEKYLLISVGESKTLRKWANKFKKIANSAGYLLGEIPNPEGLSKIDCDFTIDFPLDPIQWYLWIKNSDGYIGKRFHAVVSCIISRTPFFSVDDYGNSSILISIVNKLGLFRLGRKFDRKSKIFNLLTGSTFEFFRVNTIGLCGVNPKDLIDSFESIDKSKFESFQRESEKTFDLHMGKILRSFV